MRSIRIDLSSQQATGNKQRFTFGRLYPRIFSETEKGVEDYIMQTECIVQSGPEPSAVEVSVKFLHLMAREVHALSPPPRELAGREAYSFNRVPELHLNSKLFQTSQEAVERRVMPPPLPLQKGRRSCEEHRFCFSAGHTFEPIREPDEPATGVINRRQEAIEGVVEVAAEPAGEKFFKMSVRILNQTPLEDEQINDREAVLMRAFVSTHIVLQTRNCELVSMTDPPPGCRAAVAGCKNPGLWPVLIGDEKKAERTIMLSSPIVLPDYPKITAQSPGPLLDDSEISRIVSLRTLPVADYKKGETRQANEHARQFLGGSKLRKKAEPPRKGA